MPVNARAVEDSPWRAPTSDFNIPAPREITNNARAHRGRIQLFGFSASAYRLSNYDIRTINASKVPDLHEIGKIGQKIARRMEQHQCEEVLRSRPDDAKQNSAHRQHRDRVSDRVGRARVRA